MRSRTPSDLRGLCARCFLAESKCLCARIPKLRARTKITILRHAREAWSTSNTGRLLALAVEGLRVVDYGAMDGIDLRDVPLDEGSALLFPRTEGDRPIDPRNPPAALVVLDGSWHQARRALHRRSDLAQLPRLAIPRAPDAAVRLRRTRNETQMSTLEAVACALSLFESEALGDSLLCLYRARTE